MDYLGEIIAFGIDTLIFGVCLKQYYKNKNAIQMIQGAPFLEIDSDLQQIVGTQPQQKIPYVAIRGTVQPLGSPIRSPNNTNVAGVLQKLSIKEHIIQRNTAGFWSENERIIQEVYNAMPFVLEDNGFKVEILDPLAADIIDLDVISDTFEPSVPTVMDHIWGFFSGVRQRGIQNTEEMLRAGTLLTGIGELSGSLSGRSVRLQPTTNGGPFYLTTMPMSSLFRKLDERKQTFRWLCLLFGSIGLLIGSLMIRRYWRARMRKKKEDTIRKQLEATSKDRRKPVRGSEPVTGFQLCVVCRENPRKIILLPCGHVCLCKDCSDVITENCPICRAAINEKSTAYLS